MLDEPYFETEIIGYDCGWGCKDYGCEDGPESLEIEKILLALEHLNIGSKWRGSLGIKLLGRHDAIDSKEKSLPPLLEGLRRLSTHVKHAVENNKKPIVIGGDHTCAIGTWSGMVSALNANSKFGLIWLDAHLDAHTNETSKTGKWGGWWHGQPVAALTGYGISELKTICDSKKKISPKHVTIIGAHSFEKAEKDFVKKHGIKVYYLEDVKKKGFEAVYKDALKRATEGTKGFGVSIDLDCFNPKEAPGVGTPEKIGLKSSEVLPVLKSLAHNPLFKGLEIAEFNPHNDKDNKTKQLIKNIIETIFSKSTK